MNIIARVNKLMEEGETISLATVVASNKPSITVGGKTIVFGDGSMEGTLGAEQTGKEKGHIINFKYFVSDIINSTL